MSPPRSWPASPLFDPTDDPSPAKRNQPATSLLAFERATRNRRQVYDHILVIVRGHGEYGSTLSELAAALGLQKSSFSGRLSELLAAGALSVQRNPDGSEARRGGCRILVVTK